MSQDQQDFMSERRRHYTADVMEIRSPYAHDMRPGIRVVKLTPVKGIRGEPVYVTELSMIDAEGRPSWRNHQISEPEVCAIVRRLFDCVRRLQGELEEIDLQNRTLHAALFELVGDDVDLSQFRPPDEDEATDGQ